MAHLEGAYEQVDERLGSIEAILVQLRGEMGQLRGEMGQLRTDWVDRIDRRSEPLTGRMDSRFHWLLGTVFTSWVTLLLAIFFRS